MIIIILLNILLVIKLLIISSDSILFSLGLPFLILYVFVSLILLRSNLLGSILLSRYIKTFIFIYLIILLSCVVTSFGCFELKNSILTLLKFTIMGIVFLIGFLTSRYGKYEFGIKILSFVIISHVLLGFVDVVFNMSPEIHGVIRPTGIAGRPSILSNISTFGVFFFYGLFLSYKKRKNTTFIAFLSCLILVFLSATMKNIFVMLPGFFILVYLNRKKMKRFSKVFITIIILIVTVGGFTFTSVGSRVEELLTSGINLKVERGEKLNSSLEWRFVQWKLLINDWNENYFIQGAGIGQVSNMAGLETDSGKGFVAHSNVIEFFVELGPILFLFFSLAHIRLFVLIRSDSKFDSSFAFLVLPLYVVLFLASTGGNVYYSAAFMYMFWYLLGLIDGKRVVFV